MMAKSVKKGMFIHYGNEILKVLHSGPETQSGGSGTSTQWYICAYAEGEPTRNIVCDPNLEFDSAST
jgi:hypothetical protein